MFKHVAPPTLCQLLLSARSSKCHIMCLLNNLEPSAVAVQMFATCQQMLSYTRETIPLFVRDDVFSLTDFNKKQLNAAAHIEKNVERLLRNYCC